MCQVLALFLRLISTVPFCGQSFLWLCWNWTMGDLFVLGMSVDSMKIILTSAKLYCETVRRRI